MIDRTLSTEPASDLSARAWARIAGAGYLLIIASGIYAEFFVRQSLVVPGDPAATAANLLASEPLFRTALAAEFVMLTSDVVVALALYVLLEAVSPSLALLAAFFRLAHAAILGLNLLNTWVPLLLLGDGALPAAFGPAGRDGLTALFLEAHAFGYTIGLVFFGVHCLVLGHLVFRSADFPPLLGALLGLAGAGYLVDSFARALLTDYGSHETLFALVVFVPALVAELSFALWLLVKGVPGPRGPSLTGREPAP